MGATLGMRWRAPFCAVMACAVGRRHVFRGQHVRPRGTLLDVNGGLPKYDSSKNHVSIFLWYTVQRVTERAYAHGGWCHSKPYRVGLQVLRGIYPAVSAEGVVPSQNLCQNLWWDGVLLKNCVESCRVAMIIAQQPTQTITMPRPTAVAPTVHLWFSGKPRVRPVRRAQL
jgi:hypothetical protein